MLRRPLPTKLGSRPDQLDEEPPTATTRGTNRARKKNIIPPPIVLPNRAQQRQNYGRQNDYALPTATTGPEPNGLDLKQFVVVQRDKNFDHSNS